jgi:hypothetical protein
MLSEDEIIENTLANDLMVSNTLNGCMHTHYRALQFSLTLMRESNPATATNVDTRAN